MAEKVAGTHFRHPHAACLVRLQSVFPDPGADPTFDRHRCQRRVLEHGSPNGTVPIHIAQHHVVDPDTLGRRQHAGRQRREFLGPSVVTRHGAVDERSRPSTTRTNASASAASSDNALDSARIRTGATPSQQSDVLAGLGELAGNGTAGRTGTDHNSVGHTSLARGRRARTIPYPIGIH